MNNNLEIIKNFAEEIGTNFYNDEELVEVRRQIILAAERMAAEIERLKKDNEILSDMLRLVKAESMKRLERIEKLEGGENGDAQTDSINGVNNASSTS